MWRCFDCGKEFKWPEDITGLISSGGICIACGSENVIFEGLISDWDSVAGAKKSKEWIEKLKNDLKEMEAVYLKQNNAVVQSPLSFDDMELNEICLIDLGLPSKHPTSLEDPVPAITYYSEMNSRFLHTFLEEPRLAEIA